jgi:hypothetical protein
MTSLRYYLIHLLGGVPKYVADARIKCAENYFTCYRDYIHRNHNTLDMEAGGADLQNHMRDLVNWNPKESDIK